jgi:hypothetical protein
VELEKDVNVGLPRQIFWPVPSYTVGRDSTFDQWPSFESHCAGCPPISCLRPASNGAGGISMRKFAWLSLFVTPFFATLADAQCGG